MTEVRMQDAQDVAEMKWLEACEGPPDAVAVQTSRLTFLRAKEALRKFRERDMSMPTSPVY